jgi:hypothetical protein
VRSIGPVRLASLFVASWLVASCSPQTAPIVTPAVALPSPVVSASPGWTAARVEQPAAIEGQPTDAPVFCSPCHPILGTYINALVASGGRYLALGFDQPPSHAAAWSSVDGLSWQRLASLPAPDGSSISAAVAAPGAGGSGTGLVAVGTSGGSAAVWHTADGATWTVESLPPPLRAGTTEILTAIVRTGGGYVAAGYLDSAAGRTATFWRSADGASWTRATAQLPSGSSEVTGVAAASGGGAIVAVGISGDERRGTAAAWRSTDGGTSWQAISSSSLAIGRMLAVATGKSGFSAVGETKDQTGAEAWTSTDGVSWSVVADQLALANDGFQMVMTALVWDGNAFDAAGWKTDAGNGSAAVWRSIDGAGWTRLPQDNSFSGAGMSAVLAGPNVLTNDRIMAAGTMGWPDTHAAQIWLAPPN